MMTKNIKKLIIGAVAVAAMPVLTSCNDWLSEETPGQTALDDYFINGQVCIQTINGCYTPIAWEFNNTYYSEWFFGDIASDDALKGGQNVTDGSDAYDIDNFKTQASNGICLDYFRAKYQGIGRCNLALREIANMEPDEYMSEERKTCMLGEAHFLRAFYYFQLVRLFGGVPLIDFVVDSADDWKQPRATAEEIYAFIATDLEKAEEMLWNKNQYAPEDLGRATKGAAQAMLCKVYLYMKDYQNAYKWGKKWRDEQYGSQYSLCPVYADNFTLEGENGPESIFEIQYVIEPTSDYGVGNGSTRGTFTTILMRPRFGSEAGWGWDHPTQNLFDEFEAGDVRRDVAIGVPPSPYNEEAEVNYLGNPYYNNKYAYMQDPVTGVHLEHASRSPLNYKLMRASDALLLYAEAALESGSDLAGAKWALEEVRKRARMNSTVAGALPAFPGYNGYSDDTESLRKAIRHERRVELAMEGHRWFDITRWGILDEIFNAQTGSYTPNESEEVRAEMANFVPGKHELFPIPIEEIRLNPMSQNPGY